MVTPSEIAMLRALRKCAIVWLCLLKAGRAMPVSEIAVVLDMSHETIAGHLRSLQALALVVQIGYRDGWMAMGGAQFTMEVAEFPRDGVATATALIDSSILIKSSSSSGEVAEIPRLVDNIAKTVDNSGKSVDKTAESVDNLEPRIEANLAAMKAGGIGKNARTVRLAGQDWVTPEYVAAHVRQGRRERKGLGVVIVRMENGEEAPEEAPEEARKFVVCRECGQMFMRIRVGEDWCGCEEEEEE